MCAFYRTPLTATAMVTFTINGSVNAYAQVFRDKFRLTFRKQSFLWVSPEDIPVTSAVLMLLVLNIVWCWMCANALLPQFYVLHIGQNYSVRAWLVMRRSVGSSSDRIFEIEKKLTLTLLNLVGSGRTQTDREFVVAFILGLLFIVICYISG